MSSNPTPQVLRELQRVAKVAELELRNKEAARLQLLRIQSLISRTFPKK